MVLLKCAGERMENTLIRLNLLDLIIDNKFFESFNGRRGTVQGLITDSWSRCGLVDQGFRNLKVVKGRRTDGPRIAEDILDFAIKISESGRVRLRREDRERCLMSLN